MKLRGPNKTGRRLARRQSSYDALKAPKPTGMKRPGSQNPHKAHPKGRR